ncbi:FolC bifunctional protein [Stereum hirsutum FP-91666 SS1]|uniref:FolC bifunctional protein n=1 Tax=Stereum hirsutum (strain FP-91666) TaxID=721885 RepID=UPI000440FFEB|nr:FolC bifunctional protein [Stereum hirsutum FP-91666 SS1]EIM88551.1 FolC bifunctional protein [Stereum hirsutum FP-91666 SS1]
MSTRTYRDAIEHLNSLQSNAATIEASRASGGRLAQFAIPETKEYLQRIGYEPEELNKLNVIHITGTKGKGSTCAFADSILRHAKPSWKVGLYTSPHLVAVRERIRVNGAPISEEDFARFFFEVWDRLQQNTTRQFESTPLMPAYFRYVTLVAYHAFLSLKVDATILEVGVGGTYDCTNIVPRPIVTGVSALGIDHTAVLGKTLAEIAWQKGGIYKEGVPALTVNQPGEGLQVLKKQSEDLKASEFTVVPLTPELADIKLGLAGTHQLQNANLAVHLVRKFFQILEPESTHVQAQSIDSSTPETQAITALPLPPVWVKALESSRWPGRCQSVNDPNEEYGGTRWFLDGAHTVESLDCCVQWFVAPGLALAAGGNSKQRPRVLIFNCTNGRSGSSFLGTVLAKMKTQLQLHGSKEEPETFFDHVVFCANVTYADGGFKGDLTTHAIAESDLAQLKTQQDLASAWKALVPSFAASNVHVLPSIEHAVRIVRGVSGNDKKGVDVLVAGSLHLVGGVIEVADLASVAL